MSAECLGVCWSQESRLTDHRKSWVAVGESVLVAAVRNRVELLLG